MITLAACRLVRVLTVVSILILFFSFSFGSDAKTDHSTLRAKQIRLRLPGSPKERSLDFRNPTTTDLEAWSARKRLPISQRSFGLLEYNDVILHIKGASEAASALTSGETIPLTLIQGDFTSDGIPDLITGFSSKDGGIITVRRGLKEALFPGKADWYLRPIIPFGAPIAFSVPIAPILLATGDFNNDGFLDIAISDKKTNGIFVLPGDKRKILGMPVLISLSGYPTAILSGDFGRRDGQSDLVVATEQDARATVFIFQNPKGAVHGSPDQLQLDERVEAMETGRRNADSDVDLVLTTTHQRLVLPGNLDTGLARTNKEIFSIENLGDRNFSLNSKGLTNQGFTYMVQAELNGDEFREQILFDGTSSNLSIVRGSEDTTFRQPDSYAMDVAPVAVLPMRLNPMAIDGLVVLKADGSLSYMVPPPDAIIGVNTIADDSTVGGTVNAFISLREAILISNGGTGGDGLTTGLGRALTTGACPGAFETCNIFGAFGFGIADMIVFNNTAFPPGGGTIPISGPAARRALPPIRDGATIIDATVACPGPPTVPNCSGVIPGPVTITPLVPVTLAAADDGLSIHTSFNTIRGLNIKLFPDDGIDIVLGSANIIEACKIGVDGGNGGDGIDDTGFSDTIGGTTTAQQNIISGNLGNGIIVRNSGASIFGNFIGTDVAGNLSLANSLAGISLLAAATEATIGGVGKGNTISGNGSIGISSASNNGLIQGNTIGRNSTNTTDVPNGSDGINISGRGNTIGGATAGTENSIRGNFQDGIQLSGTQNFITRNNIPGASGFFIGGNGRYGIFVLGNTNTIGSPAAGAGNLIQGNGFSGIRIEASTTTVIQGNTIEANTQNGVELDITSNTNTIGGNLSGSGNIIEANGGAGVLVNSGTANAILSNSIFSNSGLGIDLSPIGVTPNDTGDGDTGPNNLQNFPVLTAALTGSSTVIKGTLNGINNGTFTIELYANSICDPSGFGEGQTLVGSTTTTSNATGNATFSVTTASPVPIGQFITSTATNANNTSEFSQCLVVGTCPVITLTAPPLPGGSVGVAYSTTITAAGGTAPFTFAVTAGTLPTGLTLASGGALTGTPTASGTFSFTVTATDANGCTGSQAYSVTIGCGTITVNPATLPAGTVSVAYNQTLTATGGTAPFTFAVTAGTLPTGLTLASGGALTGTPTTIGTFNFTVTATDANGCTGARAYSVTIACGTITVSPTTLPAPVIQVLYNQTLTAAGGTAPFTFAVTVGALPVGLTLSSGGVLSGTPTTTGAASFTVTATDVNGCTGTRAYTFTVACGTMTVSPATIPGATAAVPYNQNFTAAGGTAPFSFAVSTGSLPPGLTLVSGGLLNGTPTALGDFVFTARATDANGCTGSRAYAVNVVCGTITLAPVTLPDGAFSVAYNQTITASGGTASLNFAVTAGALPDGITLSSGGVITGTPTVPGTFNFIITATDALGCTGSQAYTVNITCGTVILSPSTLPDGALTVAYSQTLTASGGASPFTFALTAGSLPDGLSLASDGSLTGIPTVVSTFNFTVTATDAFGCAGIQAYSITISCAPITISPTTLPVPIIGVPYSQTLTASDGTGPYTFAVTSGVLPDGLTLSSDGNITGTPTATGTFNFTVTATDSLACTGNQAYIVAIVSFLFDDFADGNPPWDVTKGTWFESGGKLNGIGNSKAVAYAPVPWDPSGLSGCSTCNIQVDDVVLTSGTTVTLVGWFTDDKNKVELLLKEGKIILKQKVGGDTILKDSAAAPISAGVPFDVKLSFDGVQFEAIVNGSSLFTKPASVIPNGKVGLVVKKGTGTFGEIRVE